MAEAGAFAVVIEGVGRGAGPRITEPIAIPTIGIGASPACDGQILVTQDMLGLLRLDAEIRQALRRSGRPIEQAAQAYAEDVARAPLPRPEHVFAPKPSGNKPNV